MPTYRSSLLLGCLLLTTSAATAQQVVLETAVIRDRNASAANQEAVTFLKPRGWSVEGGIKWYPNHLHQANCEVRIRNPKGPEQIETFPFKNHVWMTNWVVPFPVGSNYLGAEVQQPITDPKEYVRRFVLPRHRPDAEVVGYSELPQVAKEVAKRLEGQTVRAGRTRIAYQIDGQDMEEDIYVVLGVASMDLGGGRMWSWAPDRVFGLRAAKGELDEKSNLLLSVINSVQIKQGWFCEYMGVCELFRIRMMQGIEAARRLSDQITANSDYVRQLFSDAYAQRQAAQDRIHARFSDYIRGVERYHSPHERHPVQLPSGYNYVWASPNGQYVLSNNANFDPNVGSTQNWTQLRTVQD